MVRKLTYDYMKTHIESFGYELLSKEYKNAATKLKMKCPLGHFIEKSYNNFQQGRRCPICANNQKHTYDFIKSKIENVGYKLISNIYKNALTKLELYCNNDHIFFFFFNSFQQGQRCPICFGNKKLTFSEIKNNIESHGFDLMSKEYKNAGSKLMMKCKFNHIFERVYNDHRRNPICPICTKGKSSSKGEKEIVTYIKSIYGGNIIENDRSQIINPKTGRMLELDIWLPELNKAIEYNGEWWHSFDERKYCDDQKLVQCQEKGIDLLIINDEKWKMNKDFNILNTFIYGKRT